MRGMCRCTGGQRCSFSELESLVQTLAYEQDLTPEAMIQVAAQMGELAIALSQIARAAAVRQIVLREGSKAAAGRVLGISGVRVGQLIRGGR